MSSSYKQNVGHELAAMIVAGTVVAVLFLGLIAAIGVALKWVVYG